MGELLESWAFAIAGIVGCALGARYRVAALIAATLLAAALLAVAFLSGVLGFWQCALAMLVLQLGYVSGLVLGSLWRGGSS